MSVGERLGRVIWWRILRGMRKPRGRFLQSLRAMAPDQRARAHGAFVRQEKFARRLGPKLLTYTINGFFLVLAVTVLYNLAETAQILGWLPTVEQLRRAGGALD